ncbi:MULTISPECIES: acetate kinase [Glaesserella]|uniref:Acetate kinase n=1 Tax=Glaesserella australis TaxID=2094024 RepID=A0A328C4P7_9PAST|nr:MULTISPECIES: acetate kinase [Glaesserella]AUI66932.1 acetate kinase [Glaesserella sp. 15-184]RAL19504.1 acetate kinase [Glaesserella australis]
MPQHHILVINCGSSSLKFSIIQPHTEETLLSGLAECLHLPEAKISWKYQGEKYQAQLAEKANHADALNFVTEKILSDYPDLKQSIKAIGHRVTHGGEKYSQPTLITSEVIDNLATLFELAPLHNPANVMGVKASQIAFPHLKDKNVAVFDTGFHATLPPHAYLYPLPIEFYEKYGIRRYGFHGISHYYIACKTAEYLGKPRSELNMISCHLGNGASITAIKHGESIDTSMGFTPCEGLVMGTRCGDVDPALLIYLKQKLALSTEETSDLINKKSGLLGLTGSSSDFRYITENYEKDEKCRVALEVYIHRLVKYIGSYAMLLDNKLDAVVFTGGIGENSELVRRLVLQKLTILGFELDQERNLSARFGQYGQITSDRSQHSAYVIPTNEELVIAKYTAEFV